MLLFILHALYRWEWLQDPEAGSFITFFDVLGHSYLVILVKYVKSQLGPA